MDYSDIEKLFDELWPICRSITGPGITESLKIIKKHIPIDIIEVETGAKVFDWIVPPEWKLNKATLSTVDGELILSTDDSNVHVLNFSQPFNGEVSYEELQQHLYSDKELPEAVPYVTSYYVQRWGLCISEKQRLSLAKNKKYKVDIDTEFYDGALRYGDYILKGKSTKTILISTYLCHPSLANNELSGSLVLVSLYKKLMKQKDRYYTYRFIIIPETIGSLAFLAKTDASDISNIYAGIVLTCLGGPSDTISFKYSRRHWLGENSDIDDFIESLCLNDQKLFIDREFTPTGGSDERQFCSPGVNLPVVQAARTVYGEYKEYHTNLDDKNFMRISSVMDSIEKLYFFLRAFEINRSNLKSEIEGGEPMLGKRNLYPTVNSPETQKMSTDTFLDNRQKLALLLNILSLIDGKNRLQDIVEFLDVPYTNAVPILENLINSEMIKNV